MFNFHLLVFILFCFHFCCFLGFLAQVQGPHPTPSGCSWVRIIENNDQQDYENHYNGNGNKNEKNNENKNNENNNENIMDNYSDSDNSDHDKNYNDRNYNGNNNNHNDINNDNNYNNKSNLFSYFESILEWNILKKITEKNNTKNNTKNDSKNDSKNKKQKIILVLIPNNNLNLIPKGMVLGSGRKGYIGTYVVRTIFFILYFKIRIFLIIFSFCSYFNSLVNLLKS